MNSPGWQIKVKLKVVAAYEDAEAAGFALAGLDRFRDEIWEDCEFEPSLWSFDTLRTPGARMRAAREAMEANVVIIATRSGEALCSEVCQWIKLWYERKKLPSTLLVLYNEMEAALRPRDSAYAVLAPVARHAGMNFLSQGMSFSLEHWQDPELHVSAINDEPHSAYA